MKSLRPLLVAVLVLSISSCNANHPSDKTSKTNTAVKSPIIKTETVGYRAGNDSMISYIAYDDRIEGRRPIVLVVGEWWGLNDYAKARARQLAGLGYFALAVDMYGQGKLAADPAEAQEYAMPFYKDPSLGKSRIEAALAKAKSYPQADTSRLGAIGYCFGGAMVLNAAKMGTPFGAVVSFHGNLAGAPPQKGMKTRFLICHGGADQFVPEKDVVHFKKQMDSAGASYKFIVYPNATHAFTNPASTETGRKFNLPIEYNPAADTASWNDMRTFLWEVFSQAD